MSPVTWSRHRSARAVVLGLVVLLLGSGVIMLYSTSFAVSSEDYLKRQAMWVFLGSALAVGLAISDYRRLGRVSRILLILVGLALAYLAGAHILYKLPFGADIVAYLPLIGGPTKGGFRWLHIGPFSLQPSSFAKPVVVLYLADYYQRYALAAGGFKIHTTILKEAQDAAQQALLDSLDRAEARPGYAHPKFADYRKNSAVAPEFLQGAVLVVDHETGEVLAHIGGRDYSLVPYDFIESGKRPLGTAFFPFLYAAGLSGSQTPATPVGDEAMDNRSVMVGGREGILGEWGMEVASPVYDGKITARRAFENSKIAATVRFGSLVGLQRIAQTGVAFGLPMERAELLQRLCVGWEEASMKQAVSAIAAFACGGNTGPAKLVYLDRVEDAQGSVRYRREIPRIESRQATDPATAWQIHSMMAGSCLRGSSAGVFDELLEKPFGGAAKGGSTHDFADTWFLGYNKRVTCGVWTGFLQAGGGPIYPGAFSRDLALPVWQAAMNAIAPAFGGGEISAPDNVVEVPVCSVSGQRATQFCQEMAEDKGSGKLRSRSTAVSEYFRKGTESQAFCSVHSGTTSEGLTVIANLPALDAVPILPKEPFIIGNDPYHTEVPSSAAVSRDAGLIRRRTNVLDSLDVGDGDEKIRLPAPARLVIQEE